MLIGGTDELWGGVQETPDGGFVAFGRTNSGDYDVDTVYGGHAMDMWLVKMNYQYMGMQENTEENIMIGPNPSTGFIKIIGGEQVEIQSVTIVNSTGQQINYSTIPNGVDLSQNPPGLYFVQIHTPESTIIKKIMLE